MTGRWETTDLYPHAFLWDGTAVHDLSALIASTDPAQPFLLLIEGVDINDLGQILVNGLDYSISGRAHAYVVSPVLDAPAATPAPAPTSPPTVEPSAGGGGAFDAIVALALLGLGLLGLGLTRRRAN